MLPRELGMNRPTALAKRCRLLLDQARVHAAFQHHR
jgi:hypothetical protein